MIADDGVDDDGDSVRSLQRYTGNLLQTRLRRGCKTTFPRTDLTRDSSMSHKALSESEALTCDSVCHADDSTVLCHSRRMCLHLHLSVS